jgi:DNA-binding CsgD family transcriptional regulator/pimeloyl-ACP methyl ester carboxylesterase
MSNTSHQPIDLIYRAATDGDVHLELVKCLKNNANTNEKEVTELLIGHLKQSSKISQQLLEAQQQQVMYNNLADQLPFAIILLDQSCKVVMANQTGTALLELENEQVLPQPLSIGSEKQRLNIKNRLLDFNNPKHEKESEALLLKTPAGNDTLALLSPIADARNMYSGHIPTNAIAALFISQKADSSIQHKKLQNLYKLTPTEAIIAGKLTQGLSTEEIATQRGCTVATVRQTIKSILQKTNTSKQQELVALILRSPLALNTTIETDKNALFNDYLIELKDKRLFSYRIYGNLKNNIIILTHASLSCRLESPIDVSDLIKQGFCLIIPERAGYGQSAPPAYKQLLDYADDIEQLLNNLDIKSAYFAGCLAGGPYTLAVAFALPKRVKEILLLESFAPNVDMGEIKDAPFFYKYFPGFCQKLPKIALYSMRLTMFEFKRKPKESYKHMLGMFNSTDALTLSNPLIQSQATDQALESTRQGVEALLQDIVLTSQDWGFELSDIKSKCHIIYGNSDSVATEFSNMLSTKLINSEKHYRHGSGFADMLYLNFPEIVKSLDWKEER